MEENTRRSPPTSAVVRMLRAQPVWAALGVYSSLYLSWMIVRWGPSDRKLLGDLFQVFLCLPVAVLCWLAARRGRPVPGVFWAWRLIGAGAFCWGLANAAQLVYEVFLNELPYPSVADGFYLTLYPLVFAGLLLFPTARASRRQRLLMVLDAAVVAIGGAAVVWFVELGPTLVQASGQPLLQAIFSILYPVGDLIVIAALAGVLTRGTLRSSTRALQTLAAGSLLLVTADLIYGYITVKLGQSYSGGDWLDVVWFAGLLLWAVAATLQRRPEPAELMALRSTGAARRRPSWVPYVAVATGLGLLVYAERHDAFYPAVGLVLAAVISAVLVAVRQLAAQSQLIAVQRELQNAHDELAALATTDSLTGLPNHRSLVASIDHELERSSRSGREFALGFLDLDHFKELNDALGHAAGDNALRETADVIRASVRGVDVLGRWGGEEFIVLLPELDALGANDVAERVRAAVAQHRFASASGAHLTCSIGVALHPGDGVDRDTLVSGADRAMYAAKRLGRNQVIAAGDQAAAALAADADSSSRSGHVLLGAVEALAAIVDARDRYTDAHSAEVARLCRNVALTLSCHAGETHLIGLAARLHDIGKVAVPDAILNKPGRLTAAEWALMRQHPAMGADIAGRIAALRCAIPLIRAHHERFDGTGYPDGLAGEAIPLGARIISVADAFSAMVTNRPYRARKPVAEALQELQRHAGDQFDPHIVSAFVRVLAASQTNRHAA
ncbi:MAG: diguanylate cyclase [Solirubrobacteraceae bacterium]